MPEERNRIVVDSLAARHFVSEPAGVTNLVREGYGERTVHFVGNVMIDTLLRFRDAARAAAPWRAHGSTRSGYALPRCTGPPTSTTQSRSPSRWPSSPPPRGAGR